jgi:DNA-directed RNA polymerase specialized sigma24 family protein
VRGLSSREAARELGLTPENVRLIKHRALRAIREHQARDLAVLG